MSQRCFRVVGFVKLQKKSRYCYAKKCELLTMFLLSLLIVLLIYSWELDNRTGARISHIKRVPYIILAYILHSSYRKI